LNERGHPANILNLFLDKKITIYYSDDIITEYKDVLSRERFGIPREKIGFIINVIRRLGMIVNSEKSTFPMDDESDRVFFDTAKVVNAWLVTGNIKHYPTKDFICTATDFCKKFN
jgi:putative PIN family toxin of toxin-antitoxin system